MIPWLLGAAFLAAVLQAKLAELELPERLALAFGLGPGLLVILMFLLGQAHLPLTALTVGGISALSTLLLLPLGWRQLPLYLPYTWPKRQKIWIYLLLLLIGLKIAVALYSSLIQPAIGPDLLQYYLLAAKHTFLFHQPFYRFGEPPFVNLLAGWTALCLGEWNDSLLGLFSPLLLVCLALIFYYSLAPWRERTAKLAFTLLLVSLPFLLYHAGTVYADWPIAFYYAVSTFYLARFFQKTSTTALLISLLFLGLSVWVKKSGILLAGINLGVLSCYLAAEKPPARKLVWPVVALILIMLPWLCFDRFGTTVELSRSTNSTLPLPASGLAAGGMILKNLFLEGNWQLLWCFFLALLILYPKKALAAPRSYLLAIIILQIAGFYCYFRFTPSGIPFLFDNSLMNRLMLPLMPIVVYYAAELFSAGSERPDQ